MATKKVCENEAVRPFRGKEYNLDKSKAQLLNKIRRLENEKADLRRELHSLRQECDRIKEESLLDELTGVKNRKVFDLFLRKEQSHLPAAGDLRQSGSHSLALLMVDADHFKSVNDNYGHSVGDEVLVAIARALKESVRSTDTVCRWGGEEFVVIMPNMTSDQLKVLGEKIRINISQLTFTQTPELQVTVSVGGSVQFQQSDHELFERADAAMYLAKQNGRNQVRVA